MNSLYLGRLPSLPDAQISVRDLRRAFWPSSRQLRRMRSFCRGIARRQTLVMRSTLRINPSGRVVPPAHPEDSSGSDPLRTLLSSFCSSSFHDPDVLPSTRAFPFRSHFPSVLHAAGHCFAMRTRRFVTTAASDTNNCLFWRDT